MQKRVITHPVQRQFCQWLLKRHASAALERTVKQNCLGRMGLLNHRVTRLEKGPVPAAISKRTQGCFKSCGIHRQITKFTKEKAFLLPLRTKHHHPHEKKNQKSAGTEQKKPNQTKTNQKKKPPTPPLFDQMGTCCHLQMKESKATLNYKQHCTLAIPSLQTLQA